MNKKPGVVYSRFFLLYLLDLFQKSVIPASVRLSELTVEDRAESRLIQILDSG